MGGARWRFWVDRGGTFTDCIGRDPESGALRVTKVLSSDEAPLLGIRALLGLGPADPIPPCELRMGTTLATNALLERKGAPTALVITEGFGDLLLIGDQSRPSLFSLHIEKPSPLPIRSLEVGARADAEGRVIADALERPEGRAALLAELRALRGAGARSLAVSILHGVLAPELERKIGALAREAGFGEVSLSHEVDRERGLLARTETAVADAYLSPLLSDYLRTLREALPGSTIRVMQSSGGLTEAARFRGRDSVLSGPAAGVVALAHVAKEAGEPQVIGFDMGGTSTDVSRFAGELERAYESRVGGIRLRAPMMEIHTVAAGGGSLCRLDELGLRVGPESAGASPGPLCYGHPEATELTLTDVSLLLGRLPGDRFPLPLERARAERALEAMAARLRSDTGPDTESGTEALAAGFFRIAIENMAEAIRRISVGRGHDPRRHALVVFGGAGGQYACAVARRLGIRRVLLHPLAGVLSAYGMGVAPRSWHGEREVHAHLGEEAIRRAEALLAALEGEGRAALRQGEERGSGEQVKAERRIELRYRGTDRGLLLPFEPDPAALEAAFEARHLERFGYLRPGHPLDAALVRLEVLAQERPPEIDFQSKFDVQDIEITNLNHGERKVPPWLDGGFVEGVPIFDREALPVGEAIEGPALVLDPTSTLVVEPGFTLTLLPSGLLRLEDQRGEAAPTELDLSRVDPIELSIFQSLFMSVAEQMGIVLRRTAVSTNIRERLDFSCAVFDREGGLVANAPHIPVHLGAMSESVRAVQQAHPHPAPGEVFATNHPAQGGSHLPDITVVSPIHAEAADGRAGDVLFYVASRGHHADVGGVAPGSMPPFSSALEEEGVVFSCVPIVRGGELRTGAIRAILEGGPHPARRPEENLADLAAQIAANRRGERLLRELIERYTEAAVSAYMGHVQDEAASIVRARIRQIPDGRYAFEDALDDGSPIRVSIEVEGERMRIDFGGSAPELPGNLNAPRAVTLAAVLYVLRALVDAPIPLNSGCLRPVTLSIPERSVLDPSPERAVAGGNVETSQRVVDVLLGALGAAAASQGTMNNLSFGDTSFGYYETIAGGAGAGPGFDGADCVHTHMTNSRITDPEVLEARFPVRLVRFERRRGSGGAGERRGGDGVVREIEALAPLSASILSERRTRRPFGLAGGEDGAAGRNLRNGEPIGGKARLDLLPGDRVRIETPGGGGYGPPSG